MSTTFRPYLPDRKRLALRLADRAWFLAIVEPQRYDRHWC